MVGWPRRDGRTARLSRYPLISNDLLLFSHCKSLVGVEVGMSSPSDFKFSKEVKPVSLRVMPYCLPAAVVGPYLTSIKKQSSGPAAWQPLQGRGCQC
eukprot:2635139-Rhodomonas_salina.2